MRLRYNRIYEGKKKLYNELGERENGMRFKVTLSGSFDYVVKDYGWSLLRIGKFI